MLLPISCTQHEFDANKNKNNIYDFMDVENKS
jgi:hypothetical protein